MSIRTTEDRFRELGMKPPDLSFLKKPVKPGEEWGREPIYNTRVLVDNWFEDRRQYKNLCSRCTGDTIYGTDYRPYCPDDKGVFPPSIYQRRLEQDGEGWNLLRNTEDYCQYLQNYTTTYDLMHNWEVRRAGVKPKPWRTWKLVHGSLWAPQNDNTVSFGNLTQFGYRQGPQVPLLPNDWDVYANNDTEYKSSFPKRRYPQDYVHCRKAASKEIYQEIENMSLAKKPKDPCDLCGENYLYQGGRPTECDCRCMCHQIDVALRKGPPKRICPPKQSLNVSRFSNLQPCFTLKEWPGKQTLHSERAVHPYKALKHPPHLPPVPCPTNEPSFARHVAQTVGDQTPDLCKDYAGDVGHDYKGPSIDNPLCECFPRK
ncbi:hypothetical protein Ocin01_09122 [Orchesella cincta]|uniref:Uncharacterized protein n=1 Tax=Orchesella cincta TaxID=48709 RepID=A0A1D2MWY0_ORCCI|nr:hypothetical protein Ocin01_09122 [Orchesella cincta]